jgi:hypothetical protein
MLDKIRNVKETGSTDYRQFHKVGYEDAKTWMERRLAAMKSGAPNWAATAIAGEWQSGLPPNLTDLDNGIAEIKAANLVRHYARWHVPPLGNIKQQHPDGVFRFLGGQLNSTSSTEVRTCKVKDLQWLINNWGVQGGGLSEIGVNWSTYPSSANLASWFKDEIPDMRTHTAHNTHEKVSHHLPGGTGTFSCRELVRYVKQQGTDHRGLGRWCSTLFYADPHHCFCLVSTYNMGRQKPRGNSTIYQQQVRCIKNNGFELSPSRLFIVNFVAQLQVWQQEGDRLLIFMDINEHISRGNLAKYLRNMGLQEATQPNWGTSEPHTYVRGTELIEAVQFLPELTITLIMQLSFHKGVGNHRTVLMDISTKSAIGKQEFCMAHP